MSALAAAIKKALGPLASAEVHSTTGLVGAAVELANHDWRYALGSGGYALAVRLIDAIAPIFANGLNVSALSGKAIETPVAAPRTLQAG